MGRSIYMPTILQRLFPIPEVKIVLSAYRDEMKKIANEDSGFVLNAATAVEQLKGEIVATIHAGKATIKQKIAAGKAPRVLVLLIISNLAYRHIGSGQNHVYRGRLSLQGNSLRLLWCYTMNELENVGEITAEGRKVADQNLNEAIKEVG